jgi:hypothetical protein
LQAQAQGDIRFINAEFVKVGGRPGHEGLFRIAGQPVSGRPAMLRVSLSAEESKTADFHLVSERGKAIQELKLHAINADRNFMELQGDVELPATPFRIAVIGRDSHGGTYQRFYAPLFHAESVEVAPALDFDELPAGETREAAFIVRNSGAARTFKVTATDARRFVNGMQPRELRLDANESGKVIVQLSVPASSAGGVSDDLVIVAASTMGPATTNSCVVHLMVAREQSAY